MNSLKILIAEDNELNIKYLELLMNRWGISPDIARDGQEALDLSSQNSYQLIFMDINMPELNGLEVTLKIRHNPNNPNQKSPIIALSADILGEQIQKSKEIGMNDFLPKPFTPNQIKMVLQKYCTT